MINNRITFYFNDIDDVLMFLKKNEDFNSFKIQIILKMQNDDEILTKALPSYIYISFEEYKNRLLKDYNIYIDEYDQKNSTILEYIVYIYIISDEIDVIEKKKKYLTDLRNNNIKLESRIKIKIKKFLTWMIKTLK